MVGRMKSKGYAKGGAKMMKAMGGKMAKGYAKGGAKMKMMKKGSLAERIHTQSQKISWRIYSRSCLCC